MYGSGGEGAEDAPGQIETMGRRREDLAAIPGVELVDQVAEMDREMYRTALKAYGVSDKQLAKLKALDGLAKNGGRLLSVSLQMTHQNYVGQLHNLAEVADEVREKMSADGIDAETYSYLAKIYVECVKEAGKGYGLMMTGTEAMVRMMASAKSTGPVEKATSGWGPMKKVRKAEGGD